MHPRTPLKTILGAFRGVFLQSPNLTDLWQSLCSPQKRSKPPKPKVTMTEIGTHGAYALVPPHEFSACMRVHWINKLGLCSSSALEKLWTIMASTFNAAIVDTAKGIEAPWRILQPPTGSGKTQGTNLFAAMQAKRNRFGEGAPVGSIVVTRFIAEASKTAAEINNHAGMAVAIAHNSETPRLPHEISNSDVLVITHQAYMNASANLNASDDRAWEKFLQWKHGRRLLTVIDESLANAVDGVKVTADEITQVLGFMSLEMERDFRTEHVALELLKRSLVAYSELESDEGGVNSRAVFSEAVNTFGAPDLVNFSRLRQAMITREFDILALGKDDFQVRKDIARKVDGTLDQAQSLYDQWVYYTKNGNEHSLNTASLSIPWGAPGPVVLDATARAEFLWDLFEDRAIRVNTPSHVRRYENVTLHVARSNGVGKRSMTKNFKARFARLVAELEKRLSADRSVFLCTHRNNEHTAEGYQAPFSRYAVGHWGAVDGRNDWKDFDTAVIFGLSYRDQTWSNNLFMAVQGFQGDEWLQSPEWKRHKDVRRVMQQRQLSVSIIQAINRIQCRKVVDADGNCLPANIFIVLPADKDGDEVLRNIQEDMPGLTLAPWDFEMDGPRVRTPRKGSSHRALLTFVGNRGPGATPMSMIQRELGLTAYQVKKLKEVLNNGNHITTKALAELGARYEVDGRGRGAKSYLVKR